MNHGCYVEGTTCAQSCNSGECYCIYSCEPGYCMTQFNPSFNNINDPSHGLLCNSSGIAEKIHNPNAPLCVPCASVDPNDLSSGVVTQDGAPSPASFVSSMTRDVPVCGLMDPGIDDGLQMGVVSMNSPPLYAHMFPSWWYLPSVQAQIYIQVPGVPPTTSCVTKRNPLLEAPMGNAGFYQVVYAAGGGIEFYQTGPNSFSYMAFGEITFFGDFGNNNNIDISMCWKFYQEKCIVNYGVRAYVCNGDQSLPSCNLQCELFLEVSNVQNNGTQATICKRMTHCNLATCPSPNVCLGPGDPQGCSPVADLGQGQRIVYELFDTPPQLIPSEVAIGRVSVWWVIMVVIIVILLVAGVAFGFYYYYRLKIRVAETV